MSDKQSIKDLGSRAIASTMFFLSAAALVFFVFLDLIMVIGIVAELKKDDGSVGGFVVGLLVLLVFTALCVMGFRKYDKERAKYRPAKVELVKDDAEDDGPIFVVSVEAEKPVKKKRRRSRKTFVKPEFEIRYLDSNGNETVRQIAVLGFDGRYVDAYCFLRDQQRTFIVDRIKECVDISTGEVISDDLPNFFYSLNR